MIIYHGVSEMPGSNNNAHHFCYSAGVMILSKEYHAKFSIDPPSRS